jgi:ubiquitin carboxyl-terminal hydrolase 5/13
MLAEPRIKALIDGVMHSLSSARQETVKAWEEELQPCEHTLTLHQRAAGHIAASGTFPTVASSHSLDNNFVA